MSELDLIPAEYRIWIWQLRWLKRWAWMLVGIVVLTLSGSFLLQRSASRIQAEVHDLEQRKNISLLQRQEIQNLTTERETIRRRLDALEAIRRSDSTIATLVAVDGAMAGQAVWFQQWQFDKPAASAPSEAESSPSRMTVQGQALDHATLSRFVASLLSQPVIESARITRSALRRYVSSSVVDFEVVATLRKPAAEAR